MIQLFDLVYLLVHIGHAQLWINVKSFFVTICPGQFLKGKT